MLDGELLIKALKRSLQSGGDYADIFVEWRRPTSIKLEDGRIEKTVSGVDTGCGLRLIFDGKTAYAYTNDLTERGILDMAASLSGAVAKGEFKRDIDLTARKPLVTFEIKLPPDAVPLEKKVALLNAANAAARAEGSGIKQVSVMYRDSIQKVQMGFFSVSGGGALAEDLRIHTVALVQVIAEEGGVIQTGYEPVGGLKGFEIFDESPLEEAARKAARLALMMLKARRAPGGRMPVVISSEAGGTMIHEAIGHGLEADLAMQGLSVYSGKLGQQVASPLVTVMDDATLPGRRGSFGFDDEGTPSQRTVLVKDGVLMGFMCDRLNAMRFGLAPTGNGRRESYRNRPIPRMTNTFISPGSAKPEDVLGATQSGLFVKKMGGGQVNTVTGDFVFDVQEGYIIENGRLGEPVRGATLTGSGPVILMAIDMVASDLGFSIGTCGKDGQGVPVSDAMPTVRIPEMVVGGATDSS